MTAKSHDLAVRLVAALADVRGLRPAVPRSNRATTLVPWNLDVLAVDLTPAVVELRVIALALPVLQALEAAEVALRKVLAGTAWEHACLRLVVVDLDVRAMSGRVR